MLGLAVPPTLVYLCGSLIHIDLPEVARMEQWLERRRKDLILASLVRIPQWDVGAGPYDETV
jgi:hypothetical protein